MKKKIFILLLCVVLIATCILCGVTGIFGNDSQNSPKPQTPDTAATENMTFPSKVDSKSANQSLLNCHPKKQNPLPNGQARTVKLLPLMTAEGLTLSKRVQL